MTSYQFADAVITVGTYDSLSAAYAAALKDADSARAELDGARRRMDRREAEIIRAGAEGKNEGERKANLLLTLLTDDEYRLADDAARATAEEMRDAESTAKIAYERCRLARAALALRAAGQ